MAHLPGERIRGCMDACAAANTKARPWVRVCAGHRALRRACESTAHTIQHAIRAVLALTVIANLGLFGWFCGDAQQTARTVYFWFKSSYNGARMFCSF